MADENKDVTKWVGDRLVVNGPNEVLLVGFLVDDSGSIQGAGNTQSVIDGHNAFVGALHGSPADIRVITMFLNDHRESGFKSPRNAELLTLETYVPRAKTPLYKRSVDALRIMRAEAEDLRRSGKTVRTIFFIFTDGGDNDSAGVMASDVKVIVDELLLSQEAIVGGCAVSDGSTNFWQVFDAMGIPENWIKVLEGGHEIRQTMTDMGTMSFTASRSQADFRHTTETGFGRRKSTT